MKNDPADARAIRAVLLDIEGTTTSVAFVYDVLFPYARRHVPGFLETNAASGRAQRDLQLLRREHAADLARGNGPPCWSEAPGPTEREGAVAYVHWLMDRDRKSTGLKALQGRIWEQGYRNGELRSHVYPDVLPAFQRWRRMGKDVCIFSSGSVQAQKLLFGHTTEGDLTPFLQAYFDTTTGPKREASSYVRIAAELGAAPHEIVFVSDTEAELDAARSAGMPTALCARGAPPPHPPANHAVIQTFDQLLSRS